MLRRQALVTAAGVALVGLLGGAVHFARREPAKPGASALSSTAPAPAPHDARVWPGPDARLTAPAVEYPDGFGRRRVYLDAGHGAPDNAGNTSCFCELEEDFTLGLAADLSRRLQATGRFDVRQSREGDVRVGYHERVEDADRWGAEAFVSLHSDIRGPAARWSPEAGVSCPHNLASPGFSVLYADEGEPSLAAERLALARALARRMQQAGWLAYRGAEYVGLYEEDATQAGVFLDRRPLPQRIFVLRRPAMRSVLVETHHALDPREALRWRQEETLLAFAASVAGALADVLPPQTMPSSRK